MPISRGEFDKGENTRILTFRILDLLQTHKDRAFTEEELIRALNPDFMATGNEKELDVNSVLYFLISMSPLLYDRQVEYRVVSGTGYYSAKQ